jgi:organic hydroperoxide reductase OsmC/OhrA
MTAPSRFTARIDWTGNRGEGTAHYRAYDRSWRIAVPGKPAIDCSNDPALGGDPTRMNPEDLLLSALAGCHMLWFLHLAADAGIRVVAYTDRPEGLGETASDGAGRFTEATLRPCATVPAGTDLHRAAVLHGQVHRFCFIARSVGFPVRVAPRFRVQPAAWTPL